MFEQDIYAGLRFENVEGMAWDLHKMGDNLNWNLRPIFCLVERGRHLIILFPIQNQAKPRTRVNQ